MFAGMKQLVAAAAVAVGAFSTAACAAAPNYQVRRVPMGPRPDQYVFVRTAREAGAAAPYALTGRPEVRYERKLVQRWSGGRLIGPVWVTERVAE